MSEFAEDLRQNPSQKPHSTSKPFTAAKQKRDRAGLIGVRPLRRLLKRARLEVKNVMIFEIVGWRLIPMPENSDLETMAVQPFTRLEVAMTTALLLRDSFPRE